MILISPRTLIAVTLMLVLTNFAFGYPLPFNTSTVYTFITDLALYISFLYLARSIIRFPVAVAISIRQALQSRRRRGMGIRESIFDGFYRGFLDRRRWSVGQLAMLDRLALLVITWLSVTPVVGTLLVKIGGLIGIALMLIVYLIGGTFSFLLDDSSEGNNRLSLPFLNIRRGE